MGRHPQDPRDEPPVSSKIGRATRDQAVKDTASVDAEPPTNPLVDLGELYQREAAQRRECRAIARRVFAEVEAEAPFLDVHQMVIEAVQNYCNDISKLTLTGISSEGEEIWKKALIQARRELMAMLDGTFDWSAHHAAHARFDMRAKD